jgi:hypothetical protein
LLQGNIIDAGIIFSDEDGYFSEFNELAGRYVEIKVDRISIEFLSTPTNKV